MNFPVCLPPASFASVRTLHIPLSCQYRAEPLGSRTSENHASSAHGLAFHSANWQAREPEARSMLDKPSLLLPANEKAASQPRFRNRSGVYSGGGGTGLLRKLFPI